MDDKPVLEWVRLDPVLTPEEQAQRAALQAEIDRLNEQIKELSQRMTEALAQALARRLVLARRLTDVNKR